MLVYPTSYKQACVEFNSITWLSYSGLCQIKHELKSAVVRILVSRLFIIS